MVCFLLSRSMDMKICKAHRVLLTALLLAGPATTAIAESVEAMPEKLPAGTIFKSVDSEGNVVFTDQPGDNPNVVVVNPRPTNISDPGPARESAAKLDTQKSPGEPAAAVASTDAASTDMNVGVPNTEDAEVQAIDIDSVAIVSPLPDATLIDVPEPLYVGFQTEPVSIEESGLTAEVYVDGRLAVSGTKSLLPVNVPDRGTHTLLVKLIDKDGRTQVASKTQSVHIKKRVVAKGN